MTAVLSSVQNPEGQNVNLPPPKKKCFKVTEWSRAGGLSLSFEILHAGLNKKCIAFFVDKKMYSSKCLNPDPDLINPGPTH
jgi:hypothetical protein